MDPKKPDFKQVRKGIGGSRIAALAGLSPWAGPHDVWLETFGQSDEKEVTTDLLRGKHVGPALCKWYAEETGKHVSHMGAHEKTLVHPEYSIVRATPDGLVGETARSKRVKVLEVKSPHWRTADQWGEPGTDMIPEHYLPQVTWEMAAAGLDVADVAALIGGQLLIYSVRYNPRLFEALLHIALQFWRDHVEICTPPPIDASDGARALLGRLYPRETLDLIEATEEQVEMLEKYAEAQSLIKGIEDEKKAIQAALMEGIGEHEGITSGVASVYWKTRGGRIAHKGIAERLLAEKSEEEQAALVTEFTGKDYRHFQIYPKKKK